MVISSTFFLSQNKHNLIGKRLPYLFNPSDYGNRQICPHLPLLSLFPFFFFEELLLVFSNGRRIETQAEDYLQNNFADFRPPLKRIFSWFRLIENWRREVNLFRANWKSAFLVPLRFIRPIKCECCMAISLKHRIPVKRININLSLPYLIWLSQIRLTLSDRLFYRTSSTPINIPPTTVPHPILSTVPHPIRGRGIRARPRTSRDHRRTGLNILFVEKNRDTRLISSARVHYDWFVKHKFHITQMELQF